MPFVSFWHSRVVSGTLQVDKSFQHFPLTLETGIGKKYTCLALAAIPFAQERTRRVYFDGKWNEIFINKRVCYKRLELIFCLTASQIKVVVSTGG